MNLLLSIIGIIAACAAADFDMDGAVGDFFLILLGIYSMSRK